MGILDSLLRPNIDKLREKRDIQGLIKALSNKDKKIRRKAIASLRESGMLTRIVIEPLIVALKDEWKDIRLEAVKALREIKDPRAVEPLIGALKDGEIDIRLEAVKALREIKDPCACKPLISALKDGEIDIRLEAVKALREIKDPCASKPLIGALKDGEIDIRLEAVKALREIKDPRAVEPLIDVLLTGGKEVRKEAAQALIEMEVDVAELVIPALKNENLTLRRLNFARILGQMKDSRAVDFAVDTLIVAARDENWENRQEAVNALGEIKDPRTVDPLIAALDDQTWPVRQEAAKSLERLDVSLNSDIKQKIDDILQEEIERKLNAEKDRGREKERAEEARRRQEKEKKEREEQQLKKETDRSESLRKRISSGDQNAVVPFIEELISRLKYGKDTVNLWEQDVPFLVKNSEAIILPIISLIKQTDPNQSFYYEKIMFLWNIFFRMPDTADPLIGEMLIDIAINRNIPNFRAYSILRDGEVYNKNIERLAKGALLKLVKIYKKDKFESSSGEIVEIFNLLREHGAIKKLSPLLRNLSNFFITHGDNEAYSAWANLGFGSIITPLNAPGRQFVFKVMTDLNEFE